MCTESHTSAYSSKSLLYNFILTGAILFAVHGYAQDKTAEVDRTIMAIFAHPDDEMTVAPILSKYASEGDKVYLVICTDGRYGTNDFSGLEGGDSLAELRREEMKCSAEHLGVELIHLDYHDQLRAGEGYDGHVPHAQSLLKKLHSIISEKKPDVLITWGPDGGTTHMDHRLVGASVTQVFVSQVWDTPKSLFYVGTPSNLIEDKERKILAGMDQKYLNVQLKYNEADLQKTRQALKCHVSQITPEGVERIVKSKRDSGMTVYLREFIPPQQLRTDLFQD